MIENTMHDWHTHPTGKKLWDHFRETATLESINAVLGWDERTMLPPAGGQFRGKQMALIAGLIHRRQTDPRIEQWLHELSATESAADPHSDQGATLRVLQRDFEKQRKVPAALVEALTEACVVGQQIWVEALRENSFQRLAPQLETILRLTCEKADAVGFAAHRYDALLDDYEPTARTESVEVLLNELATQLGPLVRAIADSGRRPPSNILRREYPLAAQQSFARAAAERIGFDFQRGRLDVTQHPFCSAMGPSDCRITTRYDERSFTTSFFGTLHEAGHGLYEQGLRPQFFGLPPGRSASLGIHESQSRMWENFVGRSPEFWKFFFPRAVRAFPSALADVEREDFLWAVNNVRPSLIRVEADEVTYNLHIVVRFQLEVALTSGQLRVSDLPDAWNDKYEQLIGIRPHSAAAGVLQDIHWSAGLIGYFPTYTLGNIYAAQFFARADAELSDLRQQFKRGDFSALLGWLRTNIHHRGHCYDAPGLVHKTCHEPATSKPLMQYLLHRLGPLYGLG